MTNAVVKSADRTLAILDLLTEHHDGLTLTEIQRALEFPKSSTYVLLMTMVNRGFLEQDTDSRRFRVGIRLWQAGQSYVAVSGLERAALPYMQALRDQLNETVQLATLDGADNVYIAKVDSDQQLRLASRVGVRLPAYATGIGKAMLATLSDSQVQSRFVGVEFVRYTPHTISTLAELIEQLGQIRADGYSVDNGEYTSGVYCVAAAIRTGPSTPPAAVSISIPEVRRTETMVEVAVEAIRRTADEISSRMGYRP